MHSTDCAVQHVPPCRYASDSESSSFSMLSSSSSSSWEDVHCCSSNSVSSREYLSSNVTTSNEEDSTSSCLSDFSSKNANTGSGSYVWGSGRHFHRRRQQSADEQLRYRLGATSFQRQMAHTSSPMATIRKLPRQKLRVIWRRNDTSCEANIITDQQCTISRSPEMPLGDNRKVSFRDVPIKAGYSKVKSSILKSFRTDIQPSTRCNKDSNHSNGSDFDELLWHRCPNVHQNNCTTRAAYSARASRRHWRRSRNGVHKSVSLSDAELDLRRADICAEEEARKPPREPWSSRDQETLSSACHTDQRSCGSSSSNDAPRVQFKTSLPLQTPTQQKISNNLAAIMQEAKFASKFVDVLSICRDFRTANDNFSSPSPNSVLPQPIGLRIPNSVVGQMVQGIRVSLTTELVREYQQPFLALSVPFLRIRTRTWIYISCSILLFCHLLDAITALLCLHLSSRPAVLLEIPSSALCLLIGYLSLKRASVPLLLFFVILIVVQEAFRLVHSAGLNSDEKVFETFIAERLLFGFAIIAVLASLVLLVAIVRTWYLVRQDSQNLSTQIPLESLREDLDATPFLLWYFSIPRIVTKQDT